MRKGILLACILLLCASLAVLMVCRTGTHTVTITDVTKSETIILKKRAGQGYIYALTISADGRIDGKANIAIIAGS